MNKEKIEKAISYFEHERLRLIDYFGDEKHPEKIEAVELALEALRKERETAPICTGWAERFCPTCGEYIPFDGLNGKVENAPKRCAECGQMLKWKNGVQKN